MNFGAYKCQCRCGCDNPTNERYCRWCERKIFIELDEHHGSFLNTEKK